MQVIATERVRWSPLIVSLSVRDNLLLLFLLFIIIQDQLARLRSTNLWVLKYYYHYYCLYYCWVHWLSKLMLVIIFYDICWAKRAKFVYNFCRARRVPYYYHVYCSYIFDIYYISFSALHTIKLPLFELPICL